MKAEADTTPPGGHLGPVRSVAVGPYGAVLASGGDDAMVRVWDAYTGELRVEFGSHTGPVRSVAFGPDGAVLASGDDDGMVRVWDVVRAAQIHAFAAPGPYEV